MAAEIPASEEAGYSTQINRMDVEESF